MTRQLHRLSSLKRWGVVHTIQEQSVADHTFHVTVISRDIARALNFSTEMKLDVLNYALEHDMPETFSGDIPHPAKHDMFMRKSVDSLELDILGYMRVVDPVVYSDQVKRVVKIADITESVCFLRREQAMGNTMVRVIHDRLNDALQNMIFPGDNVPLNPDRENTIIHDVVMKYLQDSINMPMWINGQ